MKTQGFTLIELLAVIVILAIIALIATPIVLGIIDDTKESAQIRSAEMYLKGVANAVMKENLEQEGNFKPTECTITSEGNLDCDDKEGILEVEVDGEKPINGNITFEEGKIKEVRLEYQNAIIVKNEEGNLVYSDEESGSGSEEEEILAPGLYDDKGTVIYSWEELINSEKLPIQMIDIMGNPNGTTSALKFNNGTLSTELDVMSGAPHSSSVLNGHLVLDSSVKTISSQCFMSCTNLKSVTIPKNVTSISGAAFAYCSNLMDINYEGTRQEWSNINLELSHPAWNINCPAIVHCSDGDVGCLTCGGTGTIDKETTCTKCDGGCTVLCPSCAGLPGTPCSHRCFHCDGGSNLQEWTVCTACNGTGQMDGFPQCPACNGAKMIRWCTTCNSSSGYFNAKNCMICNGSGFVDGTGCGTCHGAGFVGCDKCNSTGKIQSSSDCPDCE